MNRLDYKEMMADVKRELEMSGGNFEALFGNSEEVKKQAELIAAVALIAADRYYSHLTRMEFDLRLVEEEYDRKQNEDQS